MVNQLPIEVLRDLTWHEHSCALCGQPNFSADCPRTDGTHACEPHGECVEREQAQADAATDADAAARP